MFHPPRFDRESCGTCYAPPPHRYRCGEPWRAAVLPSVRQRHRHPCVVAWHHPRTLPGRSTQTASPNGSRYATTTGLGPSRRQAPGPPGAPQPGWRLPPSYPHRSRDRTRHHRPIVQASHRRSPANGRMLRTASAAGGKSSGDDPTKACPIFSLPPATQQAPDGVLAPCRTCLHGCSSGKRGAPDRQTSLGCLPSRSRPGKAGPRFVLLSVRSLLCLI